MNTFEVGTTTAKPGEIVRLPVRLLNGQKLADLTVVLAYRANIVSPVGAVARGPMLSPAALFEANTREGGTIYLGFAQASGVNGTGVLAEIPFKVVGPPGSRTDVTARVTTAGNTANQDLTLAVVHGAIEVPADTPKPDASGDADGDGTVTAGDALAALKMSVRLIPVELRADADGDGRVTARDARLIVLKVVGGR